MTTSDRYFLCPVCGESTRLQYIDGQWIQSDISINAIVANVSEEIYRCMSCGYESLKITFTEDISCEDLLGFYHMDGSINSTVYYSGESSIQLDKDESAIKFIYNKPYPAKSPIKILTVGVYINIPILPQGHLYYVMRIGKYRDIYWNIVYYGVKLNVVKVSSTYYWNINDVTTSKQVLANTWYHIEVFISEILNKLTVKVDGDIIYDVAYDTTIGRLQAISFESYPSQTYPVGGERVLIDDIHIEAET